MHCNHGGHPAYRYDAPALGALDHGRDGRLDEIKHGMQVDREYPMPFIATVFPRELVWPYSDRVDQHVQLPELLPGRLNRAAYLFVIAHISQQGQRPGTEALAL